MSHSPSAAAPPAADSRLDVLLQVTQHVRNDTFARRWTKANGTKSGYEPAARYEYQTGEGGKRKKQRCSDLFPLTTSELTAHLQGRATVGVYFVLPDGGVMAGGIDVDAKLNKVTNKLSRT